MIKQPEQWERPEWVKYFIDFICSENQKSWDEVRGFLNEAEKLRNNQTNKLN